MHLFWIDRKRMKNGYYVAEMGCHMCVGYIFLNEMFPSWPSQNSPNPSPNLASMLLKWA